MPLYDYKCPKCSHQFTEYGKYEDVHLCPKCNEEAIIQFPIPARIIMGDTLADSRIRDRMKKSNHKPKSSALFDDGNGNIL